MINKFDKVQHVRSSCNYLVFFIGFIFTTYHYSSVSDQDSTTNEEGETKTSDPTGDIRTLHTYARIGIMDDAKGLALALEEASTGYREGGIPVSQIALHLHSRFTYLHTLLAFQHD